MSSEVNGSQRGNEARRERETETKIHKGRGREEGGSTHHCADATNSVREAHCCFAPTEVKM